MQADGHEAPDLPRGHRQPRPRRELFALQERRILSGNHVAGDAGILPQDDQSPIP